MQVICFEDDRVDRLRPITQARPAYAITCASFRLIDWLRRIPGDVTGSVRPYLEVIQKLDYGLDPWSGLSDDADGVLLVNAASDAGRGVGKVAGAVGAGIPLERRDRPSRRFASGRADHRRRLEPAPFLA